VAPRAPAFAAGLHFWHALAPEQQASLMALWEAQDIRKADWDGAVSGLRSQQWAVDIRRAFSGRFHFRDPERVNRDARIGVPPEGILLASRAKGWIAAEGEVRSNADLYASIRGIEQMAAVSAELTMLLVSVGAAGNLGEVFARGAGKQALARFSLGLKSVDTALSVCGTFVEDDSVRVSIDAVRLMSSVAQGKLDLVRSGARLMKSPTDVVQALGLASHVVGESLRSVELARTVGKAQGKSATELRGLDEVAPVLGKLMVEIGKSLESGG
jgi:hypothetical protein